MSDADSVLRAERDLYKQLLELGSHDELEPFIQKVLALVVEMAHARKGYLELRSEPHSRAGANGANGRGAVFSIGTATPPDTVEDLRASLSEGVIAEAMATGKTVLSMSALHDPRFRDRGSVRRKRIEEILCVPIGKSEPLGVIYLQDRAEPGPFADADRAWVERVAAHVAPFVDRLLLRQRSAEREDPTAPYRASLGVCGVVGRSQAIANVLKQVTFLAPHVVSVLITGPTGTGKTQIARVIHDNGPRASMPFVELNCAALPANLLENELFGAAEGAHSTATRAQLGKVAAAEGGTLLLDEVSELDTSAQSKLLQLLQSGEYYPLGSAKAQKANIRVIAATNTDLGEAIAKRTFREDLFYRLNVLPLRMPSLAERTEDLPLLATHFCRQLCREHGLPELRLSVAALHAVETNDWPGNVRQLVNAIQAAALRASGDDSDQIEVRHLFPFREGDEEERGVLTYQQHLRIFKRQLLSTTLRETSWNVSEAARRLDLARSHVNKLIGSLGLERDEVLRS